MSVVRFMERTALKLRLAVLTLKLKCLLQVSGNGRMIKFSPKSSNIALFFLTPVGVAEVYVLLILYIQCLSKSLNTPSYFTPCILLLL